MPACSGAEDKDALCNPAGLDFYCPDGLAVYNDGNTPMSFAALSASVLLPDGSPCRRSLLQPDETAFCDIAWSLSQPELELAETLVQITVQGSDTGSSPATSLNFTAAAAVPVPQAPAMSIKLEQAYPASVLGAGTLQGSVAAWGIRTLWICSCSVPAASNPASSLFLVAELAHKRLC
jgi:hypothetical protein